MEVEQKTKSFFGFALSIILILGLFILSSYLVHNNLNFIQNLIGQNIFLGALIYFVVAIVSIVIFPFVTISLVPIATNLLGWPLAGAVSTVSWTIGALIAFYIGRKYGRAFIKRPSSIKRVEQIEKLIPETYVFISLVILRITIPSDILSYAVGMFTKINYKIFTATTIIGIIPTAFFLAYIGSLSTAIEIIAVIVGVILVGLIFFLFSKRSRRLTDKEYSLHVFQKVNLSSLL